MHRVSAQDNLLRLLHRGLSMPDVYVLLPLASSERNFGALWPLLTW